MTVRNPLVIIPGGNPQIQELPAGDSIGGAAQGPVGMTWQGAWNSGTSYVVDDAVSNGGSSYIAIAPSTNQAPPNATYWNVLASKGDTGATGGTGATGPAGSPGSMVKLAQVVTSSSQATISFSSIPQTSEDLMLVLKGRDTATGSGNLGVRLQFNGDTTSGNYTQEIFQEELNTSSSGGNNAAASTGFFCGRIPGSSSNANAVGQVTVTIPNYTRTTYYKTMTGLYGAYFGNNAVPLSSGNDFGVWKNTAAVTSLTLTAGGTAFVDGTVATLYGLG